MKFFNPVLMAAVAFNLGFICQNAQAETAILRNGIKNSSTAERPAPKVSSLPFTDNDYAKARAEAIRTKRLLFVDVGATWCHTCMSLKSFVLSNPKLAEFSKDYVALAIDTEKSQNEPFLAAFPVRVWPTLWVIEPVSGTAIVKWQGAATLGELSMLLEDATLVRKTHPNARSAFAAFVRGKSSAAQGKNNEAIKELRDALTSAPADWRQRPQVTEALSMALYETEDYSACVQLAQSEAANIPDGTSLATLLVKGLESGRKLDAKSSLKSLAIPALVARAQKVAAENGPEMLADDRSEIFNALVETLHDLGDVTSAKLTATKWAVFLEGEAAKAPTPQARSVFDAHRMLAYNELGEPNRSLTMLQESEKDIPDDYNAPARLAKIYLKAAKYDESIAAANRALSKMTGPRLLLVSATKIDALIAKGDNSEAKAAISHALQLSNGLKLNKWYAKLRLDLEARLASLSQVVAH